MTKHQLYKAKTTQKWLTRELFDRLQNMTREEIMNLPPVSHLHKANFVWENFESTVFFSFIQDSTPVIKRAFTNIQIWILLSTFDPRKLPITKDKLTSYGTEEWEEILNHV